MGYGGGGGGGGGGGVCGCNRFCRCILGLFFCHDRDDSGLIRHVDGRVGGGGGGGGGSSACAFVNVNGNANIIVSGGQGGGGGGGDGGGGGGGGRSGDKIIRDGGVGEGKSGGGGGGDGRIGSSRGGYVGEGGSGGGRVGSSGVCADGGGTSNRNNSATFFYIKCTWTHLVLDVKEGTRPEVIMGKYHGVPNQLWEYNNGMIYSKLNGLVLEVMQRSSSVCISEPHCRPSQLWDFEQNGTIRSNLGEYLDVVENGFHYKLTTKSKGNYTILSKFNIIPVCCNHVISDHVDPAVNGGGGSGGGGGRGGSAHCNPSVGGGGCGNGGSSRNNNMMLFYIKNKDMDLVLEANERMYPTVNMRHYHGGPNQLWGYKNRMIYSKLNGFVLEVKEGTCVVCISKARGELNQLWDFEGDGTIRSKLGLVLDVKENISDDSDPCFVCKKTDGWCQEFRIVPVSC